MLVNNRWAHSVQRLILSCGRAKLRRSSNIVCSTNSPMMWPTRMWHSCMRGVSADGMQMQ